MFFSKLFLKFSQLTKPPISQIFSKFGAPGLGPPGRSQGAAEETSQYDGAFEKMMAAAPADDAEKQKKGV